MNKQDKHKNGAFITTRRVQTFSDLTLQSGSFSKLTGSGVKNKDPFYYKSYWRITRYLHFTCPLPICHEERMEELGLSTLG